MATTVLIPDKLYKEISQFCTLNDLDVNNEIPKILQSGFNILRFGIAPFDPSIEPKVTLAVSEDEEKSQTPPNVEKATSKSKENKTIKKGKVRIIKN